MNCIFRPERWRSGLIALLLLGCDQPQTSDAHGTDSSPDSRASHSATFIVFGTTVSITLDGVDQEQASALFGLSNRKLMAWHRRWHPWEPGEITRLNEAIANGQSLEVEPDTAALLIAAQDLSRRSDGLFNPAIGGLVSLWGFHTDDYPVTSPPPSSKAIDAWLQHSPQMSDLRIEGRRVGSINPAVQIDTGGLAKGQAVDSLIRLFEDQGVPAALVNAGGDLRGYGQTSPPWRIAIRHPLEGGVLAAIDMIGDEALFTSGNYSRFKQVGPDRYAHILDPGTGWPVDRIVSATVVASSGLEADAAATALVVASPEQVVQLFETFTLKHVLLIDADGCVRMDSGLQQRLRWQHAPPDCLEWLDSAPRDADITGD